MSQACIVVLKKEITTLDGLSSNQIDIFGKIKNWQEILPKGITQLIGKTMAMAILIKFYINVMITRVVKNASRC